MGPRGERHPHHKPPNRFAPTANRERCSQQQQRRDDEFENKKIHDYRNNLENANL